MVIEHTYTLLYVTKLATEIVNFTLTQALNAQSSAPTLKSLRPTRWTVRMRAIEAVLANYQLLLDALEVIQQGRDEYAMKAHGFLNSMLKCCTYFGLKVSHLIFSATEQLLPSNTTIQDAVQASKLL